MQHRPHKKRVLVFCEFYRPGHKGGGGMWTVANLIDRLSGEYEFAVVCRNHDGVADTAPYTQVRTGEWNSVSGHEVFFVDPSGFPKRQAAELVNGFRPDIVFVNSVFGLTTRMFLGARRSGLIGKSIPVILAPCGELSDECLAIKALKKTTFLRFAKVARLFEGLLWKASSRLEALEIERRIGKRAEVMIAPDLAPDSIIPHFDTGMKPAKTPGRVRLVVAARIARKKNITYLLERFRECRGEFHLDIAGPVDADYWEECEAVIRTLPPNVSVSPLGPLRYEEVLRKMLDAHFFVLPTLNENFGYVFLEALAAGCPLLISENTIWSGVEQANCGRVLRLDRPDQWVSALEELAGIDQAEYAAMSAKARQYAERWLATSGDLEANRKVLEKAAAGRADRANVG